MRQAILDGAALRTRGQVHDALAAQLDFPAWYGGNLDALFDCLTACRAEPVEIVLWHPAELETNLGRWARALRRVLQAACEANPLLTVTEAEDELSPAGPQVTKE